MDQAVELELIHRFTLSTFLEAVRLYEEGMASVDDIDIAMRAGAGLKEGPFHWADAQGLDVVLEQLTALQASVGDRFRPPASLRDRVGRGQLGAKIGQGYLSHGSRSNA